MGYYKFKMALNSKTALLFELFGPRPLIETDADGERFRRETGVLGEAFAQRLTGREDPRRFPVTTKLIAEMESWWRLEEAKYKEAVMVDKRFPNPETLGEILDRQSERLVEANKYIVADKAYGALLALSRALVSGDVESAEVSLIVD